MAVLIPSSLHIDMMHVQQGFQRFVEFFQEHSLNASVDFLLDVGEYTATATTATCPKNSPTLTQQHKYSADLRHFSLFYSFVGVRCWFRKSFRFNCVLSMFFLRISAVTSQTNVANILVRKKPF